MNHEMKIQYEDQQNDDSKKNISKNDKIPSMSKNQSNISVLNMMSLILKIYKHMKNFIINKDDRIIILKIKQKNIFIKLCKTNPS